MSFLRQLTAFAVASLPLACGGSTASPAHPGADASTDAPVVSHAGADAEVGDTGAELDGPTPESSNPDANAVGPDSCETLVLAFVGCSDERKAECEREYAAVSAASRATVDTAVACLRSSVPAIAGVTWPAAGVTCTPAAIPPASSASSHWFHGGCQGDDGNAALTTMADPSFPACSDDAGHPQCFFGDSPSATL